MTQNQEFSQQIQEELDMLTSLYKTGTFDEAEYQKAQQKILQKAQIDPRLFEPMGFWETYFHSWKNLFNFKTRATRSEFFLFNILNSFIYQSVILISAFSDIIRVNLSNSLLFTLISSLIPLSVYVRRFHDKNRSAIIPLLTTFFGIMLILSAKIVENTMNPLIALTGLAIGIIYFILLFYAFCIVLSRGTVGINKYGLSQPSKNHVPKLIIVLLLSAILIPSSLGIYLGYQKAMQEFASQQIQHNQQEALHQAQENFIKSTQESATKQNTSQNTPETPSDTTNKSTTPNLQNVSTNEVITAIENLENDQNTTLDTKESQEAVNVVNDFSNETAPQNGSAELQSEH